MQIYMLFVPDYYIVSQLFEDKNSAVVFELRTFFVDILILMDITALFKERFI